MMTLLEVHYGVRFFKFLFHFSFIFKTFFLVLLHVLVLYYDLYVLLGFCFIQQNEWFDLNNLKSLCVERILKTSPHLAKLRQLF